jgi:hypothetical protein
MSLFETAYEFDEAVAIEFVGPDSSRVPLAVRGLEVGPGALLHASMRPDVLERVARAGWFHLDGESTDVDWDPNTEITVTLGLVDTLANSGEIGDGEPLLLEIGRHDAASKFSATDSWRLHEAIQTLAVPGDETGWVQIGLRTRWATDAP